MAKKRKKPVSRRISAALSRYLKKLNPSRMKGVTHVRVKKLKGGGVTITPARMNPAYRIVSLGPRGRKTYEIREVGSGTMYDYTDNRAAAQRILSRAKKEAKEGRRR